MSNRPVATHKYYIATSILIPQKIKQEQEALLNNELDDDTVAVIFDNNEVHPSFTAQVVIDEGQHTKETSSCYCAELSLGGDRETQEWRVELENDLPEVVFTQGS